MDELSEPGGKGSAYANANGSDSITVGQPKSASIAEHDPADALRRYTHYRSILADHAIATNCEGEQVCPSCGWLGVLTRPDACDEIVALAAALNISTEGAS